MKDIIFIITTTVLILVFLYYLNRTRKYKVKYQMIFNSAINTVFFTSGIRITDSNSRAARIFGIDRKKLTGKSILDYSPEFQPHGQRSFDKITEHLKEAGETGEVVFEWQFLLPNGREVFTEITFRGSGKKNTTIHGIVRDIDQRKRLESQIKLSQKLEVVGLLASGISHDFNNLLVSIMGNAELLSMKLGENDQFEKHISTIMQGAQKGKDLTKKIALFTNKEIINSDSTDVHEIINTTVELLERSIDKKISMVKSFAAHNSRTIGDSALLQSLLLNLGVNSAEAMPRGGVLTFTTTNVVLDSSFMDDKLFSIEPGEFLEVSISDTGIGMTEEVLTQAFQPFYTTKTGSSSGLGLSAVYEIVKDHKGLVKVYSEKDLGTVINIFLPVDPEFSIDEEGEPASVFRGSGSVIIIDDEPLVLETTSSQLKSLGYEVFAFDKAIDAIEFYKNNSDRIVFVMVDINMPEVNGYEAATMIESIDKDCKILFNSGFSKSFALKEFEYIGDKYFIQKPFVLNSLSNVIKSMLFPGQ